MQKRKGLQQRLLSNEIPDTFVALGGNMASALTLPSNTNIPASVTKTKDAISAVNILETQDIQPTAALVSPELKDGLTAFDDYAAGIMDKSGQIPKIDSPTVTPDAKPVVDSDIKMTLTGEQEKDLETTEATKSNKAIYAIVIAILALILLPIILKAFK